MLAFKPSLLKLDVSAVKAILLSNKYSITTTKKPIDPLLCAYYYLNRVNYASLSLEDRTYYTYKANKVAYITISSIISASSTSTDS
ncbi:hypothetical protein PtrV1_03788 [Pyrenophora tritici-repentis]|nr:hypothetical protein PtrV1_03788 [Pyrenophora tritici-repentis]